MSAFANDTFYAPGKSYYLRNPVDTLIVNGTITMDGSPPLVLSNAAGTLNVNGVDVPADWSAYPTLSNNIKFDVSNNLSNVGGSLYFNDELLAKAGEISNVADWSLYPAISNVDMQDNAILMKTGVALSNSGTTITFGSDVLNTKFWSTLPATQAVNMGGNTISNAAVISGQSGTSNLTLTSSSNLVLQASNTISNQAGLFYAVADAGINPAYNGSAYVIGKGGFQGKVFLEADAGVTGLGGVVDITAKGGSLAGVGYGGEVDITATTPIGISNVTSAIKLSAAGINSYAGVTGSIGSTFGYNYIHGDIGVNITAGLIPAVPNFAGTLYLYGTAGTECANGFYVDHIYPYSDTLTFPNLKITGNTLTGADVELSNVVKLDCDNGVVTGVSNATITNLLGVSTINGSPYVPTANWSSYAAGTDVNMSNHSISNLSNINGSLYVPTSNWSSFSAVSNVNFLSNSLTSVGEVSFTGQPNTSIQKTTGFFGIGYDAVGTDTTSGSNGDFRARNVILTDSANDFSNDMMLVNAYPTGRVGVSTIGSNRLLAYADEIPTAHGYFYSSVNQSQAVSNVPLAFTYTGSNVLSGLSNVGSRIYSTDGGSFLVSFSIQFARTSGGTATIAEAWVRQNGVDVADTNSRVLLAGGGNGEVVLSVPVGLQLAAGDYLEIVMGTPDYTNTIAQAFPARTTPYPAPAIPSIIVNVDQVG